MSRERFVSHALVAAFAVLALTCFGFAVARTTEGRYGIAAAFVAYGVVLLGASKATAAQLRPLLDAIDKAQQKNR